MFGTLFAIQMTWKEVSQIDLNSPYIIKIKKMQCVGVGIWKYMEFPHLDSQVNVFECEREKHMRCLFQARTGTPVSTSAVLH